MKKVFVLLFTTIIFCSCSRSANTISNTPLAGFLNVPWKSTKAETIKIINTKGAEEKDNEVDYYDTTFDGKSADIHLSYLNNQFYKSSVLFHVDSSIIEAENLVFALTKKYGEPNKNEIEKTKFYVWKFSDGNTITVIAQETSLFITYVYQEIQNQIDKEKEKQNNKDL